MDHITAIILRPDMPKQVIGKYKPPVETWLVQTPKQT